MIAPTSYQHRPLGAGFCIVINGIGDQHRISLTLVHPFRISEGGHRHDINILAVGIVHRGFIDPRVGGTGEEGELLGIELALVKQIGGDRVPEFVKRLLVRFARQFFDALLVKPRLG